MTSIQSRVGLQVQPHRYRYDELRPAVAVLEELGVDAVLTWDQFPAPVVERT